MKIIALTGPKGSGKDTVAGIIKSQYSQQFDIETIAFADPIKQQIEHIFQLPPGRSGDKYESYDKFKRSIMTYDLPNIGTYNASSRHVVREIGMLMRKYDVNQFTDYVNGKFHESRFDDNKLFVVTDLRFDNEYMMLKSWNAQIVKIIRPHYKHDGHITERGFDDHLVNKLLMNDGSLDYLNARVKIVMDSLIAEEFK